jgi:protein-disulfide isomerase
MMQSKQNPSSSRREPAGKRTARRAAVRRQQRSKGPWIIGGVVLLAVALVAVLIALNNNARPAQGGAIVPITPKEWPQASGTSMGPADAQVVLHEFSDFQCPFCKRFSDTVKDQIVETYVQTGKVRFEFHHFIVIDANVGGQESRKAAEASECAAEQNQFWNYHNLLFANQTGEGVGSFSDARLKQYAATLDLDTEQFNSCFDARKYRNKVTTDEALARSLNVRGTPSLFVNNQIVQNPLDFAAVQAAVDAALAQAGSGQ